MSNDESEKNDLAQQRSEKVAELTMLMDTTLAGMQPPIRGEAKRYGLNRTATAKAEKPKSERKKNQLSAPSPATPAVK